MKYIAQEQGFTLVEVIVTLAITVTFLGIILQISHVSNLQQNEAATRSIAMNTAQSNLNKFPDGEAVTAVAATVTDAGSEVPFYCKPGATRPTEPAARQRFDSQPDTNLIQSPDAEGLTLLSNDSAYSEDISTKLVNSQQRVVLYAPHGCTDSSPGGTALVKLESTVDYGSPGNRHNVRITSYVSL